MYYAYQLAINRPIAAVVNDRRCNPSLMQSARVEIQYLLQVFLGILPVNSIPPPMLELPVQHSNQLIEGLPARQCKKRKTIHQFTNFQRQQLDDMLNGGQYLTKEQRQALIQRTGLTSQQITSYGSKIRKRRKLALQKNAPQ